MTIIAQIMTLAAEKYRDGTWRWNEGSRPDEADDRDIFLAVCGAAAEMDRKGSAYDALMALRTYLGEPWGLWNGAKGRTYLDVISALEGCAAEQCAKVAA